MITFISTEYQKARCVRTERQRGAVASENWVAANRREPKMSQLVVLVRQNHNRFPQKLRRRPVIPGRAAAAAAFGRFRRALWLLYLQRKQKFDRI